MTINPVLGVARWAAALCLACLALGLGAHAAFAGDDSDQSRARATGSLRLTKRIVGQPGVADPGRFDLRAAGAAVTTATNVGDGGTTGTVTVPVGPYVIAEFAHRPTSMGDYNPAVLCSDTAPGHSGSASSQAPTLVIVVQQGDAWDCTLTNTRRYAALALEKTGPPTAMAGSPVTYGLTVTNVGTVPFPLARVSVTDALCAPPGPVLRSVNGDPAPATLDPGDRWSYDCQVATANTQPRIDNVGVVTATDLTGRTASATAQLTTLLTIADEQPSATGLQVEPLAIRGGRATLYGPRGCPVTATTAFVKGRRILRVTYYVDGHHYKTLTRPNKAGHWTLNFGVRRLRPGPHRLSARIQFRTDSYTRTQTLRLSFVRCRGSAVTPSFTG